MTSLKKEAWPALSIVHEKNNEKLNKDYRFIRAELELFHILESDFVMLKILNIVYLAAAIIFILLSCTCFYYTIAAELTIMYVCFNGNKSIIVFVVSEALCVCFLFTFYGFKLLGLEGWVLMNILINYKSVQKISILRFDIVVTMVFGSFN